MTVYPAAATEMPLAVVRWILSVVSLVAYVFTKVSVTVYAGAIVFRALLPELQITMLTGFYPKKNYPEVLRRIKYRDPDGRLLVFLTNDFSLPALMVAELYKGRWQIELFFKWIKQHLRIKAFFGTSANAVKTQIWIALCVYLLVAITKKRLRIEQSLYTILQILSVSVFEKMPLLQAFRRTDYTLEKDNFCKQLSLWD